MAGRPGARGVYRVVVRRAVRIALAVIAALAVALLLALIGFKLSGYQLTRARVAAEQARDTGAALSVTVEGTRELTAAADRLAVATSKLRSASNAQNALAAADPLAQDQLSDSVRARIAADERRLCASGVDCRRPDGTTAAAGIPR